MDSITSANSGGEPAVNRVGFIGLGSMGGVLLQSLLESGALRQREVSVSTRTMVKARGFFSAFPDVETLPSNAEVAWRCQTVFICVRTGDAKGVFEEIRPHLRSEAHVVYINAGLTSKNVARAFDGKLTKVIPSLTCQVRETVSLVFHNPLVTQKDAGKVERWLSCLGKVKVIDEDSFEIGADMTSCAPAFIASIMGHFVDACVRHGRFEPAEAEEIVLTTLLGTAKLLREKGIGFSELITEVATKGGITEEGIKVLDRWLPAVFDELLETTLKRHDAIKSAMDRQYS